MPLLVLYGIRELAQQLLGTVLDMEWRALAVDFMQEPGVFLRNLVEKAGYDSCHRTEEYDAQPCYEEDLSSILIGQSVIGPFRTWKPPILRP